MKWTKTILGFDIAFVKTNKSVKETLEAVPEDCVALDEGDTAKLWFSQQKLFKKLKLDNCWIATSNPTRACWLGSCSSSFLAYDYGVDYYDALRGVFVKKKR